MGAARGTPPGRERGGMAVPIVRSLPALLQGPCQKGNILFLLAYLRDCLFAFAGKGQFCRRDIGDPRRKTPFLPRLRPFSLFDNFVTGEGLFIDTEEFPAIDSRSFSMICLG